MKGLLKYLSPFAPDQSGAVSVLFELGGITVICDAGGCTGNVCGFDEPRWFSRKSAIFSAGLRDMDAILGRDDRLADKLKDTAAKVDASFAAVIGTPVPAVIATDYRALERMTQKRCGIPVLSIECTGTRLYDEGEEDTYLKLFQKFAGKAATAAGKAGEMAGSEENGREAARTAKAFGGGKEVEKIAGSEENGKEAAGTEKNVGGGKETGKKKILGVLGMTPLDISRTDGDRPVKGKYLAEGWNEVFCYGMGGDLSEICRAGEADKNLVVSPAGLKAAKYLEKTFGTPYEEVYPFLTEEDKEKLHALAGKRVLILHQQAAANEIRREIRRAKTADSNTADGKPVNGNMANGKTAYRNTMNGNTVDEYAMNRNTVDGKPVNGKTADEITAATFFMQKKEWKEPQDFRLSTEDELADAVRTGGYDAIVGDKMFRRALPDFTGEFLEMPHFAVSGSLL